VDTACRLLEQQGVGTMSIEDVADAAGVSRSLVYAYFGDRDGLVAEVYLRVLEQVDEALEPHRPADLPRDQATVAEIIEGCLLFAEEHPAAWRLLVTDSVRRHPAIVRSRSRRVLALAGMSGGPVGDALVADAILGLLEAGVLHWLDHSDLPPEEAATLLADILWTGLRGVTPSAG
jgi:AcrR family transcriptional regulator